MKKSKALLLGMMMVVAPLSNVYMYAADNVTLHVGYVDPTNDQGENPRSPIIIPEVSIENYTLTFSTPCYGYTLELLDGDGEVVYTTIITSTTVNLPSTLSGDYELCLYPDESIIYFFGYVLF